MNVRLTLALILLCAGWPPTAGAAETITRFHSDLVVRPDSRMEVTEIISVRAEGDQIKRGIYRDFPTRYADAGGGVHEVEFDLQAVLRDDHAEPYHIERRGNGVRIYIGRRDYLLPPGEYTYTLRYVVGRHLGYFERHDELYWNVTGNGWTFPIEQASARVVLPASVSADAVRLAAYTGPQGARDTAFTASTTTPAGADFLTTAPLAVAEGLTIVVGWPKGHVTPPPIESRASAPVERRAENSLFTAKRLAYGMLALLLGYYLIAWFKVGRDPRRGVIVPRWEPPANLSPAAMRYIRQRGMDDRCFGAAVIDLAVKGYITLSRARSVYSLTIADPKRRKELTRDERKMADRLIPAGTVRLATSQHKRISEAREILEQALARAHAGTHFRTNRYLLLPGILLSVLTLIACAAAFGREPAAVGVASVVSLPWLVLAAVFLRARAWAFAAILGGASLVGLLILSLMESPAIAGLLVLLVGIHPLFDYLLGAPTLGGRRLLDQIEGFRRYLHTAERDELKAYDPPEDTPELFERFLPYALALDVEQAWAERFADVLTAAGEYRPDWYADTAWHDSDFGRLASDVGKTFADSISSAATPPGSSSGFSSSGGGGGGSSGGGGGGGGGGGW